MDYYLGHQFKVGIMNLELVFMTADNSQNLLARIRNDRDGTYQLRGVIPIKLGYHV